MRWYFATDAAGGMGQTGELARLAVLSARAVGGLEPVLLYHGARTAFTAWMEQHGVRVHDTSPAFIAAIEQAQAAGTYKAHSIGHWLRIAIPEVEHERDFVLYTDCDVIFLRGFDWSRIRPKVFAAAPEFKPDAWNYFNAGVMVLNVPAMRATFPAFEAQVKSRIQSGEHFRYDDQIALNEAYRGLWDRLDPRFNWKPYWDFNAQAVILHFHGPKPGAVAAIAAGRWHDRDPTAILYEKMVNACGRHYLAWCRSLGDSLQNTSIPGAIEFASLASALTRYRREIPETADSSFMNVKMFNEIG
jgi:hypothetical protein